MLDGDGAPARALDVGVRDGKIAAIGSLGAAEARQRIDASGLVVAPGFIDMHNHSDYTILAEPKSESMIRQGVTTMVLGESRSAGPVKTGANDDPRSRSDGANVDWTTLGGYFQRARAPAHGDQHRVVRGRGTGLDVRQRLRAVRGDLRRDRRDEEARRAGDGRRRHGPLDGAPRAAVQPGDDGQSRRARESRQAIRRDLCLAHTRRGGRRFPGRRRGHPGREGREHTGGHPPHEDRAQEAVGSRQRDHRDGPEGARRGHAP